MNNTPNKYNNISVDIDRLFEIEPEAIRLKPRRKIYRLVVRYSSAILIKLGLYEVLVEIGFIRKWFLDFIRSIVRKINIQRPIGKKEC